MKNKSIVGGFTWSIDGFKQRVAEMLRGGGTGDPMASGVFEFEERRWRMLLYIRPSKCKLYLQLNSAVHPVRVAIISRWFLNDYIRGPVRGIRDKG